MQSLKFPILILVVILFNSINCDRSNDSSNVKCCANTTNQQIVVEFSSNVVQHEYIVQFKNYYQTTTRAKFLKAALDNAEVIKLPALCST